MSSAAERDERFADVLRRRASRSGRSPLDVAIDRVWRFFCSVRAALYEIVFLALLVLIGTLKGSVIPAQIPRYVPALEPLVMRWYAFDVFHSAIFSLTLALLAVAIVVCTLNRAPAIWRAIARPTVPTPRAFFRTAERAAQVQTAEPPAVVAAELTRLLRGRRYRVLTEERNGEVHIYADKHRFGRLGTLPFHLALILVLVGAIVGSERGFRETAFAVPEGSVRAVGRGTGLRVGLERFIDTYDELGAPTEYRSDLVLYRGDEVVRRESITVNNPLSYNNVTFYQASFGQAAAIRVLDPTGAAVFDDAVEFVFQARANTSAPAAQLDLPAQGLRVEMIYPNNALNDQPEIGTTKLRPGEMYVQVRDLATNQRLGAGEVISQGNATRQGGFTVEFVRERRFTLLQVASNPGIPILFAASILGVFGMAVTFGFPHRRMRGLVTRTETGSQLLLAPLARRDWSGQREFVGTLAAVEGRFGPAVPYGG